MLKKTVSRCMCVAIFLYSSVLFAVNDQAEGTDVANTSADTSLTDDQKQSVEKKKKKEQSDKPGFLQALTEKSKRSVKARVFGFYRFSNEEGHQNQFEIDSARFNLSFKYDRFLEAAIEYDFAGLVDDDEVKDGLRDAYIRIEPLRAFGIQLGQFKKPFSRLELTSRKRLPTISRGETNDYALGFLHFGGRDVGAMVSGRLIKKIKLEYYAGIFNGTGTDNVEPASASLDYVFRLESKPVKWLEVGVAASAHTVRKADFKEFFDPYAYEGLDDDDFPSWVNNTTVPGYEEYAMASFTSTYPWLAGRHWMGEFDFELDFGRFEAVFEMAMGQNWWFEKSPYLWSMTGLISYKFPLFGGAMAIEPAVFAEMLHIEDEDWTWRVRMLQLTPGVNIHFGDDVRLMIHGQLARTTGVEADIDEAPLAGFWPGEWPGDFKGYKNLFIQLGFAN